MYLIINPILELFPIQVALGVHPFILMKNSTAADAATKKKPTIHAMVRKKNYFDRVQKYILWIVLLT